MTNLELGLQEAGLLDAVTAAARDTGMSIQDIIRSRVLGPQVSESSGEEERISGDDVWHRIMTDPEYSECIWRDARADGIDLCVTGEEARELCQDW